MTYAYKFLLASNAIISVRTQANHRQSWHGNQSPAVSDLSRSKRSLIILERQALLMSPADAKTSQPGSHADSTPLPVWSAYGTGAGFSQLRCLCCKSTSVSHGILGTIVHSLSEFFGTVSNEKYTWSLCSCTNHFGRLIPALVRPQHAFVEFSFNTIMSSVAQQYVIPHGVHLDLFRCILLHNETSCLFLSWDTRLGAVDPSIFASSTDIRTNSRKLLLMQCYRSRLQDLPVHSKMLLVQCLIRFVMIILTNTKAQSLTLLEKTARATHMLRRRRMWGLSLLGNPSSTWSSSRSATKVLCRYLCTGPSQDEARTPAKWTIQL